VQRHRFQHDAVTLSYLDAEGDGRIVLALHAHGMEGVTCEPLAAALAPAWRVIALDQRGHGYSDHAGTYTRDDYRGDLEALFAPRALEEAAVMIGNSLGRRERLPVRGAASPAGARTGHRGHWGRR
jgi:esterase